MVEQFLLNRHLSDILEIINDEDEKKHFSLNINFVELFESDTELGSRIIKNSEQGFCDLENEIFNVQELLIVQQNNKCSLKINTHARIYGLPICPELHRTKFPRNADTDLFLQICGTVVRVTASKMLEYQRSYTCTKCKHMEIVEADYDFKYTITPARKCSKCGGSNLNAGELNPDNCKDYQEIKIQEKASEVGVGSMPSALWITLEDDLVDTCKPGDDVIICGFVKVRHSPLVVGKRIGAEIVLKANHILATNGYTSPKLITHDVKEKFRLFWETYKDKPVEGRDLILKSFCPKLYGMYLVKLAVVVVLAGGSRCKEGNEMGIQIRSEPHLLLVGDPGTGKSQLLRYAAKVVPRAVLTTGVGTTSAGLTAAAMMEDGHWQLEGGALVLADGGVCCIDEFNSMKPHDRASIHEAMEQQTISIAKVGRVCKLQTRCTILAATNPKGGSLDPSQPLTLNLSLPSPLLSRFDIVMMLRDNYDEDWDTLIADHILSGKGVEDLSIQDSIWDLETLQQYFIVIKDIQPVLTKVANKILGSYYQTQRQAETRNKARSTVRLLDSLIRLSQAHARLMCHSEVQIMDALYAVILIETSMDGECSILLDKVNVTAPFVSNPMENYKLLTTTILQKLDLLEILNADITTLNGDHQFPPTQDLSQKNVVDVSQVEADSVAPENSNEDATISQLKDNTANALNKGIGKMFIKENFKFNKRRKLNKAATADQSNSEFEDFKVLNLIPSILDEFDANILNDSVQDNSDICGVDDDQDSEKILSNDRLNESKIVNDMEKNIPKNIETRILNKSNNDVALPKKQDANISNKVLESTKSSSVLSKFRFKPRIHAEDCDPNLRSELHAPNKENVTVQKQKEISVSETIKSITSQSLFENLEMDDNCFDI